MRFMIYDYGNSFLRFPETQVKYNHDFNLAKTKVPQIDIHVVFEKRFYSLYSQLAKYT